MVNGKSYLPFDFIKFLRNTKDGASGIGITQENNHALQTAYQRLLLEYDITITGGNKKGFLKSNKRVSDEVIKKLKKSWDEYYAGNSSTVVLNDGLEFQEASNTSVENQMNEKNKSFSDEIKEIFHISNDYNRFIKNAIEPIAKAFATALNRELLLEKEKSSYFFAPDMTELLKGSIKERYEAYQIAIKNGFKTINEVRFLENDNEIDGLDVVTFSLANVLYDIKTGNIYTPNTNKNINIGKQNQTIDNSIKNKMKGGKIDET